MGLFFSRIYQLFENWATSEARIVKILMLGLDASGKTTILYKIKFNESIRAIPTIGFNVEVVNPVKGLTFTVWDVGGEDKFRSHWRHYFKNTEGLIYVVDSADRERMAEAREELFGILESDEMRGVPVVILANKQDLPGALNPTRIVEELHLNNLSGRKWFIQSACATTREGVYEGMTELANMVRKYKRVK